MNFRLGALVVFFVALIGLVWAQPADARGDGGKTEVFSNVYVPAGETIDGDVNAVFGDVDVAGTVRGDCNAIFGQCTTVDGGHIYGDRNSVNKDFARAIVPWAVTRDHPGFAPFAGQDHRLFGKLFSSAIVILIFLIFPLRMRVALDRVERHPALSAATGAIATVALVPIGLLLLVSIIGIPLIVLEIAAVFAFVWIGKGAIALLVGRRLCEVLLPAATPSPFLALILGLVVVSAAEITPFVGWAVTALVWLVGLGAAILAFIRSTQLESALHRAPIAGPPMRDLR